MRHIVTVTHQVRAIGADRWITDGLRIYGPFYNTFTAHDFSGKIGRGVIRVRYTMFDDTMLREDKGCILITSNKGSHRTLIATSAMQPPSVKAAWRFIREWYGDKPIRQSVTNRKDWQPV